MKGRRRAVLAAVAAVLSGCSLAPVDVEPATALIDARPAPIAAKPIAATLLVLATGASAPYDTTRMAYTASAHQLAYFAHHEWADLPARMLNGVLVRALEGSRRFRAVVVPPYTGSVQYTLGTELTELRQDYASGPPAMRLAMRAQVRDGTGAVIATRRFETAEPLAQRSPAGGVAAANAAAARLLRDIASFAIEAAR